MSYPQAYTPDNLQSIINSNDSCPRISDDEIDRLITLARQRADARGEDSVLDSEQIECLIATEWDGFAQNEFGYDNGELNQFAMGVYEVGVSMGKGATLFTDTAIIQNGWLKTGDGRRNQIIDYVDDDYDGADIGEMWIPKGAQDYMLITELTSELVHDGATLADAM